LNPDSLSDNTLITLTVRTPDGGSYPVHIGRGQLAMLPRYLAECSIQHVAIVTNESLAPLYGQPLLETLNSTLSGGTASGGAALITVSDGEQYKTLDTVRTLYDQFASAGLDRQSAVIALGGGVVGDTAGFAAASYLRGLPFIQVPTSLLAMVDASVGGKVGVNLPQGKNLVGAFKQPEMVIMDTAVLHTLPEAEWRSGLAEVIKHGLLADPSLLAIEQLDRAGSFLARAIQVKVDSVERDPYEHSVRAYLNLGHTFAQALETVSGYQWRHGDAVAVGLIGAARLSHLHGLCAADLPAQVEDLITRAGLPTCYHDYDPLSLRAAMNADKKRHHRRVRFVLLRAVGDPLLADDVPDDRVMTVLASLRA